VKTPSIISGIVHPRKSVTGTTTKIGEGFAALRNTTVLSKFRLASVAIMVTTTAMITAGVVGNEVTIEMRLVPAGRAIDPSTTCHQKKL
jgi:hypothetical protein